METARLILLSLHNLLRWVVVILALVVLFRNLKGWITKSVYLPADQKVSMLFTIFLDVQVLVGLLLYFIFSPLVKAAFSDLGAAMSNPTLRYFSIEHIFYMLVAIVLAHIGSATGKKDLPDQGKFRRATIFFVLSLLLILLGIPWATRPLLPV